MPTTHGWQTDARTRRFVSRMANPTDAGLRLSASLADRYHIERELGAGGMATVYLARDLKHDRRVAVKVLHPDLAAALGAERFLAEIKTTANLQHPHILALHDSGESEGFLFYVMPYVDGESLRDRLRRERQLPIDDAIRLARQIASALDYAHRHGVIHRDVKPENVLLHDGSALVADFGIALAVQSAGGQRMTQTGLSLGTPQYMSPEQAMGDKHIDARSDIYALGAVTYEMFAGEPPFTGATVQAVVAKVIAAEPQAVTMTRRNVPPAAAAAVHRALEKVPADRFGTAAEFADALTNAERVTASTASTSVSAPRSVLTRPAVVGAAVAVAAAIAFALGRITSPSADDAGEPLMATLVPPPNETWITNGTAFSLSPNGRRVVIRSGESLVIRSVDSLASQRVPNTKDATLPFWSPDGRSIGFFADLQLKTIDLSTGAVRGLCPAAGAMGGAWAPDGTILFVPDRGAGLHRTTASGGPCEKLKIAEPPTMLHGRPYFFPDGKHFISTTDLAAYLGEIGGDSLIHLTNLPRARAVLAPPHFLLYEPEGSPFQSIFARRIDVAAGKLVGDPVKVLEGVPHGGGSTSLSASSNGVLVARVGSDGARHIARFTRGGEARDTATVVGTFGPYQRSNDGSRLALGGFRIDLWDLERRVTTTLVKPTPNRALSQYPQWSPKDTAIAYMRRDSVMARMEVVNVTTGVVHTLMTGLPSGRLPILGDWSRDGRYLVYSLAVGGGAAFSEGWAYDLATQEARKLLDERGDVGPMQISPNGRFIAYEVATSELYVRPFPGPGLAVRVTPGVARFPSWRDDGRELFYVDASGAIMAVGIREDGTPATTPEVVVAASAMRALTSSPATISFKPSVDGRQFHVLYSAPTDSPGLAMVTNWWKRAGLDR